MEEGNETLKLRDSPDANLDLSLNHSITKEVTHHGRKASTTISAADSLFTLSTDGCTKSADKTAEKAGEGDHDFSQKAALQTGNILAELTTAAWYTYVLIYFQNVVSLSPTGTGLVFLISQIVRAGITLALAFGLDKKIWRRFVVHGTGRARHILGSAGILFSWPLVFAPCIFDSAEDPEIGTVIYYLVPVFVYSICWPLVEAGHDAIVADRARSDETFIAYHLSRSELRHGSSMTLFAITWILLQESPVQDVNSRMQSQFVRLSLFIVPSGFIFVLIFHLAMGEKSSQRKSNGKEDRVLKAYVAKDEPLLTIRYKREEPSIFKIWKDWQKHPQFYKVGVVYLCSQSILYTSNMYLPLFLTQTLRLSKESIASYPLIVVITGYITNLARPHATRILGIKLTLILAAAVSLCASVWCYYLTVPQRFLAYAAVVLFSAGTSLIAHAAATLLADLRLMDRGTGSNTVGALAFVDRAVLGLVVLAVQLGHPSTLSRSSLPGNTPAAEYIQTIFSVIPATSGAMLLVIGAFFLMRKNPGKHSSDKGHGETGEARGDRITHRWDRFEKLHVDVSTKNHYEDTHLTGGDPLVLQDSTGVLGTSALPMEENRTTEPAQSAGHCVDYLSTASSIVLPTVLPKEIVSPDNAMTSLDLTSQASSTVSTCTTTDEIRKTVRSASPGLQGFYEFPKPATLVLSSEHIQENLCAQGGDVTGPVVHIVTLDMRKLRNTSLPQGSITAK